MIVKRDIYYFWLRFTRFFSKKRTFDYLYYVLRGNLPNYHKPSNLSEYLLSKLLNNELNEYACYADKYTVRDFIEKKGLKEILPKLYFVVEDFDKIEFGVLPNRFVMKMNNGCGMNYVCLNKENLNKSLIREKFLKWNKHTDMKYEQHYNYISPKIICEEFVEDFYDNPAPIDYKFMCYDGKVKAILVCIDRNLGNGVADSYTYDIDWNYIGNYLRVSKKDPQISKPVCLEEMLSVAECLSEEFKFVRVDLYYSKRGVVFSELTFTPAMGVLPTFSLEALEYIYE
ncbi:TupA-like ATPgrasp [Myroides sp. A21]|uniref:ATP-grasp fold amidoligase family protein n=1 Tax=Myroides sp. A21 TaxID=1583100 RepID=UPI000585F232|nr:ATP-grasp fold amidoligase family protein [Myroides sp. A21]AJA70395.1 TupA-like ATPgrasp [Myroides sp. A21]